MLLKLQHIQKSFINGRTKRAVLNDINMEISKGDYIAIMGRSGSGKSTLLNILGTLIPYDKGTMIYNNQKVTQLSFDQRSEFRKRHIGFVTQQFHLLHDRNVYENIKLPLNFMKLEKDKIKKEVNKVLEMLDLESFQKVSISKLSGGEQQRVAIGRAIVKKPDILLVDEPTGSLDEESEKSILDIFDMLHSQGTTIVIVTHNTAVSERCDKNYFLKGGKLSAPIIY
ncbi:ABC transporter ATP-binding protein [Anaerosacchariphilus polymeriproducens]|uniref:ABC transporter ATP-binding protein n=1 Tax=Anaerosacchariphilus polymeriproducens TaxID=1812858 RepID=UPI00195FF56D|nr:ABC transporter ATP-binding protein [Anaerosacchariphilus polymeriproducens]